MPGPPFERTPMGKNNVFIFPVWWELMPAMTKGFIDKAFATLIGADEEDLAA